MVKLHRIEHHWWNCERRKPHKMGLSMRNWVAT